MDDGLGLNGVRTWWIFCLLASLLLSVGRCFVYLPSSGEESDRRTEFSIGNCILHGSEIRFLALAWRDWRG